MKQRYEIRKIFRKKLKYMKTDPEGAVCPHHDICLRMGRMASGDGKGRESKIAHFGDQIRRFW
jgi:hypothetical protein